MLFIRKQNVDKVWLKIYEFTLAKALTQRQHKVIRI